MDKYLFGNKLYKLRTENNLTQKELAGVLGVSDKAVSKWETGEAMPRVKTLKNIADCFSVTYEDLLSEEEELKTNEAEKNEVYESFYQKRVVKVKKDIKEHTAVLLFVSMLIFVMRTELEFRGLFTVGMPVYFSSLLFGSLIPLSLNITLCVLLMFFLKTELFNSSRNITVLFTLSLFSMISQAMFFISEAEIDLFMFLSTVFVLCSLIAVFMVFKLSQKGKMRFDLKRIVTNSGLMLLAGFALYLTRTLSFPEVGRLIQIAFINYFSLFILSEIFEYKNLIDVKEHDESIEKENAYIKVLCSLAIVSLVGGLLVVSIPGIVVKQQISELNKANATSLLYSDNGINFDESSSKKYTFDKLTFVLPDDYEAVNNDSSVGLNEVLNFKKANDEKTLIYFKKENEELDQASTGLFLGEDEELLKDCFKDVLGKYPKNDLEYDALLNSIREEKFSVLNYNRCMVYAVLIFNRGISSFNGNYDLEYYNMNGISVEIIKYKNSFFNIEKTKNIEGEYIAVNVHVVLEGEKGFYNITYFPNIESQDEMFICKLINSLEKTV